MSIVFFSYSALTFGMDNTPQSTPTKKTNLDAIVLSHEFNKLYTKDHIYPICTVSNDPMAQAFWEKTDGDDQFVLLKGKKKQVPFNEPVDTVMIPREIAHVILDARKNEMVCDKEVFNSGLTITAKNGRLEYNLPPKTTRRFITYNKNPMEPLCTIFTQLAKSKQLTVLDSPSLKSRQSRWNEEKSGPHIVVNDPTLKSIKVMGAGNVQAITAPGVSFKDLNSIESTGDSFISVHNLDVDTLNVKQDIGTTFVKGNVRQQNIKINASQEDKRGWYAAFAYPGTLGVKSQRAHIDAEAQCEIDIGHIDEEITGNIRANVAPFYRKNPMRYGGNATNTLSSEFLKKILDSE